MGGTKLAGPGLLTIVDIDGNNHTGLVLDGTLHDRETNTAGTEDRHIGTLLNLGGHHGGTITGSDTAAEQAGPIGGDLGGDGDDGDIGDDGVLGEGRSTHEVQDVLAAGFEAGGTVGHHTLTLGGTDLAAQVWSCQICRTCTHGIRGCYGGGQPMILRCHTTRAHVLESNDIVAGLDRSHTLPDGLDDTRTFVTENDRESTLGILAGKCVGIWSVSIEITPSRAAWWGL